MNSYSAVLHYQKRNGLDWFVKIGQGIAGATRSVERSTVEDSTVESGATVAPHATPLRHNKKEQQTTPPSSTSSAFVDVVAAAVCRKLNRPDTALVRKLIAASQEVSATPEEILGALDVDLTRAARPGAVLLAGALSFLAGLDVYRAQQTQKGREVDPRPKAERIKFLRQLLGNPAEPEDAKAYYQAELDGLLSQ